MRQSLSEVKPNKKRNNALVTWFAEARIAGQTIDTKMPEFWMLAHRTINILRARYGMGDYDTRYFFIWGWRVLYPVLKEQGLVLSNPMQLLGYYNIYQDWAEAHQYVIDSGDIDKITQEMDNIDTKEFEHIKELLRWKQRKS